MFNLQDQIDSLLTSELHTPSQELYEACQRNSWVRERLTERDVPINTLLHILLYNRNDSLKENATQRLKTVITTWNEE